MGSLVAAVAVATKPPETTLCWMLSGIMVYAPTVISTSRVHVSLMLAFFILKMVFISMVDIKETS